MKILVKIICFIFFTHCCAGQSSNPSVKPTEVDTLSDIIRYHLTSDESFTYFIIDELLDETWGRLDSLDQVRYQKCDGLGVSKSVLIQKYAHARTKSILIWDDFVNMSHYQKIQDSLLFLELKSYQASRFKDDKTVAFKNLKTLRVTTSSFGVPVFLERCPYIEYLQFLHLKQVQTIQSLPESLILLFVLESDLHQNAMIPPAFFQLPKLKSLIFGNQNFNQGNCKLPKITPNLPLIETLCVPIDLANPAHIHFIAQLKHLKTLTVAQCSEIEGVDLSALDFIEHIEISNIALVDRAKLQKRYKNIF